MLVHGCAGERVYIWEYRYLLRTSDVGNRYFGQIVRERERRGIEEKQQQLSATTIIDSNAADDLKQIVILVYRHDNSTIIMTNDKFKKYPETNTFHVASAVVVVFVVPELSSKSLPLLHISIGGSV